MYTHIAYLSTEQKARPVGVRIVEPPSDTRQAVRGNLYVVIEYPGTDAADTQLVERALSVIQRTYYTIKGTQTFVLTEALREGIALFPTAGEGTTVIPPAGILLMALLDDKLVAVGTGPAVALLTAGNNVDVYPPYVAAPDAARRTVEMQSDALELYRQEIPHGGTVLLAGQRCLQHFTLRELASIVAYVTEENVVDVATALRNQAGADVLTGMVVVIAPGEKETNGVATQATAHSPLQRTRRSTLPGALAGQTAPHLGEGYPDGKEVRQRSMREDADISHTGEISRSTASAGAADYATADAVAAPVNGVAQAPSSPINGPAGTSVFPAASAMMTSLAQRTLDWTRELFAGFLPDRERSEQPYGPEDVGEPIGTKDGNAIYGAEATPSVSPTPADERAYRSVPGGSSARATRAAPVMVPPVAPEQRDRSNPADVEEQTQPHHYAQQYAQQYASTVSDAAAYRARPMESEYATDDEMAPDAVADARTHEDVPFVAPVPVPRPAVGRRARLFALAALSILLLTIVIVATVFWTAGRNNVAAADELLARAESSYLSAQQALDVDDKVNARLNLLNAQAFIAEANSVVGVRMERADQLSARIEQQLADLLQIVPLHALAAPLVRFPEAAQPQRVVVSDQDIYVLDTGDARQSVQYFALDATRNIVTNLEGETILSPGEVVDGVTVGRLVDMTWLPAISGVDDKAYLLVLDSASNLFRYDRRVEGVSHLNLGGEDLLGAPTQMRVYSDRLYVADTGASQIFRYGRGNFEDAPERWFGETPPSITSLRSMAIDGSIWLLLDEGLLLRFNAGTQAQFSLESGFGQIDGPVDLVVGTESTSSIYIADSAGERILVFDKNGKYLRQLQAPEGDALRNLRGIYVDEVGGVIYILTQSSLYQHPLLN